MIVSKSVDSLPAFLLDVSELSKNWKTYWVKSGGRMTTALLRHGCRGFEEKITPGGFRARPFNPNCIGTASTPR